MILIERLQKYQLFHQLELYEYLTGEEILPSNQQQIIEQAKFTYSPLGKVFEKQTKTIEDQTKIIKDKKEQIKETEKQSDKYDDNLPINKQREIVNKLIKDRRETMNEFHSSVKFDNLLYHYKGPTRDKDFSMYNDEKSLFDMIQDKDISLSKAEENQADLESNLSEIKIGGKKSSAQKKVIKNVEKFCDSRKAVINFFKNSSSMVINAAYNAKKQKGTGLKILTPTQMLKRLPIALAQISAGNNSESLLNEIRQIVYSLYRSKEITKKVYNKYN